jgi:hypothetical protein
MNTTLRFYICILLFYLFNCNWCKSEEFSNINSMKIRYSHGLLDNQSSLNLNYCSIKNRKEFSYGILFGTRKYTQLIGFEVVPCVSKMYGVKFGYINNIKNMSKIAFRYESDFILYYWNNFYKSDQSNSIGSNILPVFYFGPNVRFLIKHKWELSFLTQLGVGYLKVYSSNSFDPDINNEGLFVDLTPAIDLTYKF